MIEAVTATGADLRTVLWRGSFPAFISLYGALYGAYGMESPFLPSFLGERGLTASEIGFALASGTLVRLAAGPIAGQLADRYHAARTVLATAAFGAGAMSFGYLAGHSFWPMLAIIMMLSIFVAALAPLADTLALTAAVRERTFAYGWVRGAGSAAFVIGTLLAGQLVAHIGLYGVLVASGSMLLVMALVTTRVPQAPPRRTAPMPGLAGQRMLLSRPLFRRLLLLTALVMDSHALNDAFAVIRWREAGIGPGTVSLLWAEGVISEIAVFVVIGPWLLNRCSVARLAMLSASLGVIRWTVMASTADVSILTVSQLSHGLTFALTHLVNMGLIAETVPEELSATALTLYGTLGRGVASAVLTMTGGLLYGTFGAGAFWVMAALCASALPVAAGLRLPTGQNLPLGAAADFNEGPPINTLG
jgi:PPP family 3-phenylpropionic acid transporter